MNLAFGDGRVYNLWRPGPVHDPLGGDGKARVLGAGPIAFELVEPFRHWKVRFDGPAASGTVQGQIDGRHPPGAEGDTPVEFEIDLVSAVPPWENGALLPEARRVLEEQDEGALMGGPRFEQLARATGSIRVGDSEHRIDGGALRIRRRGIR